MKKSLPAHFYLFKGDWYELFIELFDRVQKQGFVIWEPQDKNKKHNLIIVFGASLPEAYCMNKNIWKTDEEVFDCFYKHRISKFNLHGNYNVRGDIERTYVLEPKKQFSSN